MWEEGEVCGRRGRYVGGGGGMWEEGEVCGRRGRYVGGGGMWEEEGRYVGGGGEVCGRRRYVGGGGGMWEEEGEVHVCTELCVLLQTPNYIMCAVVNGMAHMTRI